MTKLKKPTIIMATLTILMIYAVSSRVFRGGLSDYSMTESEKDVWIKKVREEPFLAYDIMGDGPNPPENLIEVIGRIEIFVGTSAIVLLSAVTLSMVRRDILRISPYAEGR